MMRLVRGRAAPGRLESEQVVVVGVLGQAPMKFSAWVRLV